LLEEEPEQLGISRPWHEVEDLNNKQDEGQEEERREAGRGGEEAEAEVLPSGKMSITQQIRQSARSVATPTTMTGTRVRSAVPLPPPWI
jgi:hypothetical protein